MIRACLLTLLGGFIAARISVSLSSDLGELLILVAAAGLFLRRWCVLAWFLLGFALFVLAASDVAGARLDPVFAGDSLRTEVRIIDFVKRDGQFVSFVAAPVADTRLPSRTRIRWQNPTDTPAVGEIWQLELRLSHARGLSNPGGYDLEAWMFREKLGAAAYVVPGKRNRRLAESPPARMIAFRASFIRSAQSAGSSKEAVAVLTAVGVGARHFLTREQWQQYARTGTSHLMAISGLHVGLAASVAFLLLMALGGVLRLPGNCFVLALLGGVLVAALYACMSGFAVPARRASCMLLFAALSIVLRRRPHVARIVAFAALAVFSTDPVAIMSPGFSLSFAAVLILVWHTHGVLPDRHGGQRTTAILRMLLGLLRVQGVLLLGLAPLTVVFFQRIALLAPVANMVLVPMFSVVIVPLVLLALLCLPWSTSISSALLQVAAGSIDITEAVVRLFANMSLAELAPASYRGLAVVVLPLAILWVILPRRWPGRWVAVIALIAVILQRPETPPMSCFDTHFLDVGQGLAVVVQTSRHTLLFDTGMAYQSGSSAAEQVVLPFLQYQGIRRIDWLIVSHADLDHAGGVRQLQDTLPIGVTLIGETLPGIELDTSPCRAGMSWQSQDVKFRLLHPVHNVSEGGNDGSCVLEVSVGEHRLLLTGDIELAAEQNLLARQALRAAAVVLVPHHGSATSSSAPFVHTTNASHAIVSAGYANRWGMPKKVVIERWRTSGAKIHTTATSGAISVRLCREGGVSALQEHRLTHHRFWRHPLLKLERKDR